MEDYVAPFVFGGPSFSILAAHSNVKALKYAGGEMGLTVDWVSRFSRTGRYRQAAHGVWSMPLRPSCSMISVPRTAPGTLEWSTYSKSA